MVRKQIYLPEDLDRRISLAAKEEQKPEAQVIRELLTNGLTNRRRQMTTGEALLGLAELGRKLGIEAEPDFSSRIDDFLYGNADT